MGATSSRPLLNGLLDIDKVNFVSTRDHDVIHPPEYDQQAGIPTTEVLGRESAFTEGISGEIWTQPIAGEPDSDS